MKKTISILGIAVFILAGHLLEAADWGQFRGPLGNGVAVDSNPPIQWNADKNVKWKVPVPGQGWSSPVIDNKNIYLTAAVPSGDGYVLKVIGLDSRTGKILWQTPVFEQPGDAPGIHGKNSHASPTPVLVGGRLYVHFGHQGTACRDTGGAILWKNQTIQNAPVHGNGGSPVVSGNRLVFSVDGADQAFVVALDTRDGSEVWRRERSSNATRKFSFSTPAITKANGVTQVISPGTDVVHSLDLRVGSVIWKVSYDGYSGIPRPVFGHGMVYMATGYGTPNVLAIALDGKGDVTDTHLRWRLQKGAPHTPSLLLVEDEIYMVSDRGIASCVDARTGDIHWQQRVGAAYSASPIYASGRIYLLSEAGVGTVLEAGTEFKSLSVNDLQERSLASYGVAGDSLVIRTAKHLFWVEGK